MKPLLVLTVCTANICRSPVAAEAIGRRLAERGVPSLPRSSGTHGGLANDPTMVEVAASRGYDLTKHVSRPIQMFELERAQVILAMDRGHLQQIVAELPSAWTRTFTLPELVRRASALPSGSHAPTFDDWIAMVGDGRTTDEVVAGPTSDDVEDPHGKSKSAYREAVNRIDMLAVEFAQLVVAQVNEARN